VSKSIGATTMTYQTTGTSTSRGGMQLFETKSASVSTHLSRRELITPDEIMRLDSSLEILLRQGAAPVIAAKVRFYADGDFRGLCSPA
jgi:type IV secretion system protein VirD4